MPSSDATRGPSTPPDGRLRADVWLVEKGFFPSRARARAEIEAGTVLLDGVPLAKPGQLLDRHADISLKDAANPYVSRGGLKLGAALEAFAIDPKGLIALDIGASTGGFTDVLLRAGAAKVFAVDVGHGQLHDSLQRDPHVVSLEGLNARDLTAEHIPEPPGLIVCDVSFISLKLALPPALALAAPGATLIALIKPQFEAGREHVGKSGVVKDPSVHEAVCTEISRWLADEMNWHVVGLTPSSIPGPEGNREFLICARKAI